MLNLLWSGMLLLGILWSFFTGNTQAVTDGILEGASEAISLCITMLGTISMWSGFLHIAEISGLLEKLSKKMKPFLRLLFQDLPENHPVNDYLCTNILANVFGLGWAATPAGLKAMEEMQKLNENEKSIASNAMCTFLVLNVSSLQLFPINILAYRQQYQSLHPEIILLPSIIATGISTLTGILFCLAACRRNFQTGKE